MITSNLWEESRHRKCDILFLESIRLSMLGVHATIVNDIFHHLIDHLRQVISHLVLKDISSTTGISAELLEPLFIQDVVILFFCV